MQRNIQPRSDKKRFNDSANSIDACHPSQFSQAYNYGTMLQAICNFNARQRTILLYDSPSCYGDKAVKDFNIYFYTQSKGRSLLKTL